MQRMMITLLIAFAVGVVLGKLLLPVLHKLKFGQNVYELAPESHKKKQGTPTMGGLVIAGAAVLASLIMTDYSVPLYQNMTLAMLLMGFGNLCIGFADDMTKIRRGKNGGLTPKQKMFFQTILALAFSAYCYFHPQVGPVIKVPFLRVEWNLGILYIPIMMFIIVGTTNSANLLDGLDGLLCGVSIIDFATLAILAAAAGLGSALYDITAGYGAECLITLINKGMIGLIAGLIAAGVAHRRSLGTADVVRTVVACVAGALTYVALYMLKTYIFGMYVDGLGMEATLVKMGTKITGSLLNALFASVVGPVLFFALKPALDHAGLLGKM